MILITILYFILKQRGFIIIKEFKRQQMGKYLIYTVTLIAYTTIHIMRMSLPFVQLDLMHFFGIRKLEMGIANACLYILIGLSYLYRALHPLQRLQFTYCWAIILSSLCYLVIPLLVYVNAHIPALFYLSLAGFGWFQSSSWPVLLSLVHTEFLPKRDGCMLGFWSAGGDIGNIIGFFMSTVIVYALKLPFQVCLLFAGLTGILMAVSVYKLDVNLSHEHIQPDTKGYTQRICTQYKTILRDPLAMIMIIMLCMLKAILYGLLLWLPMYFQKQGFKQFEGIIPIAMNVAAIVGSIVLGYIFQKVASQAVRATIFMTTLIITVITFFIVKQVQFTVENELVLLILICIIGFCVMGNFNIISAHEVSAAADRLGFQIAALSSLVMSMGNIFVGIIQFIIGKVATQDTQSVFIIFFVMSLVLIGIQIVRAAYLWRVKLQNKHQKLESIEGARQNNRVIEQKPEEQDESQL